MAVVAFEQTHRFPYANGTAFGDTGPYEQIDGILTFAVDPKSAVNKLIVDLDIAPREQDGRVLFRADLSLVRPVDGTRGSQTLIVELPNRGRRRVIDTFNMTGAAESASPPPGDRFLFEHGFTVASIGWQWDVYRSDILMGLMAPQADISRDSDPGQAVIEIRPNERSNTRLLADRVHMPLKAADLADPDAVLYVRDFEDGELSVISRDRWRFAMETDHGVEPSDSHVYFDGGFEPGKYYQVVYSTNDAPVQGAGLLAFRDVATFLRYEADTLIPDSGQGQRQIDNVIGHGVSQTGRMIREFMHLGLNVDEQGRKAYDGLLPHVAGARMGSFNHRYAQPSNQSYPSFGHKFPFADATLDDPLSGSTGGLLARLEEADALPKIISTNSSAEYWRGDGSLAFTDPLGTAEHTPNPCTRIYHFAGTQHGPGGVPQVSTGAAEGALGAHPFNVVDYTPLLRAALINLVNWVVRDTEPPISNHATIADGTAVQRASVFPVFDSLPDFTNPDPAKLWVIRTIDLGPRAAKGIGKYPPVEGATYRCLVSDVDEDGNEVSGIRLPDISQPVATHAGWNTRAPETGSPDQQIPMQGFSLWFPVDESQRQAAGDPRRSIQSRYKSREQYEQLVRADAAKLVESGFVLSQDLELVVQNALERYDYALEQA